MSDTRLEPLLREGEKYLPLVYDNLTDAVVLIRVEANDGLRCVSMNKSALEITGFDLAAVLNRRVEEIVDRRGAEEMIRHATQAIKSRKPQRFEFEMLTPKGSQTFDAVLVPIFDLSGNCTHFLGTACDITAKVRADAHARMMARRERALLDSIADYAWMKDVKGDFVAVNESLARAAGCTPEQMVGKKGSDFWSMEYEKSFLENDALVMRTGETIRCVELFHDEKGNKIWRDSIKSPTYDEYGHVNGTVGTSRDTSDIQKTLLALQESEQRLAEAEKIAGIGHFEWDLKTEKFKRSAGTMKIFGLTSEISNGLEGFLTLVHPEDRARVREHRLNCMEKGGASTDEYRIVRPDGSIRHVRTLCNVVKDADGSISRVFGINQDITEQKEMLLMLQKMNHRLAEAERVGRTGSWEWNFVENTVHLSSTLLDIYGVTWEQMTAGPAGFLRFVHPDDRERIAQNHLKRREQGKGFEVDFRIVRPDGEIRHLNVVAEIYKDSQGKPIRMVGTARDVTKEREMISELEANQHRLAEAERIGKIAHVEWDIKRNTLARSAVLYEIMGVDPSTVSNQAYALIPYFHPQDRTWFKMAMDTLSTEGGRIDSEFRILRKDGKIRYVQMDAQAFYGADGRPEKVIALLQDVTERHEFENELQKSRENLKRLSSQLLRLQEEERKKIAREIHDEFGQALTALKIDLFWVRDRLKPEQTDLLEKVECMSKLIGTSLQAMRRAITELRPTLLDELGLAEALKWQLRQFEKRSNFSAKLAIDPEDLRIDPERAAPLFRIFQEALTNVARHSGATQVEVSLAQNQDGFVMRIADNGAGFAENAASKLTHGLIGMRERAEMIGGKLNIHTRPAKGTVVEVVLRQ